MIYHSKTGQLIKLKVVLLFPNFKQNRMSIPKLLKNNFKVQASENKFEIEQQGKTILLEKSSDEKMFYLIGKRIQKKQINTYHKRHTMDINAAHDLFNHMSEQVLHQTCKERKIKLTGQLKPCPGCLYAKAKRKRIMKTSNIRGTKVGETLFIKTSGPYPRSIGGSKYWFKVVDDYSRKNWNFLMKNKSKVQHHLISLIETPKNKRNQVNYIRCDNA